MQADGNFAMMSVRTRLTGPAAARPQFLASVANVHEAGIAIAGGAEIIDVKDPSRGALGAASDAVVAQIVAHVAQSGPRAPVVSATVGDFPLDAQQLHQVCAARADIGADIVKVGLLPGAARIECIAALGDLARTHPMIAVLFADLEPQVPGALGVDLAALAEHGFLGAMIDTFDKAAGGLTMQWPIATMAAFVRDAQEHQLVCGLAGSLRLADVAPLTPLGADVLGFRGALCNGQRTAALHLPNVTAVRAALVRARTVHETA